MTLSSEPARHPATAFEPARFSELNGTGDTSRQEAMSQTHGYAAGYATGIRAAESVARAQRERIDLAYEAAEAERSAEHFRALAALQAAARALTQRTLPVLENASNTMSESALLLAQIIIGRELSNEPFGAKAALGRALSGIEPSSVREIRMNPQDLALLGLTQVPDTTIGLVADPSLSRGDAMTAFDEGFLDARIQSAFARAAAHLGGDH